MAAASVSRRSTLMRTIWNSTTSSRTNSSSSSSSSRSLSLSLSSHSAIRSSFIPRFTPISPPRSASSGGIGRLIRRELSSLLPVHSAVASACLVSKLPSEASTSAEGRFANYLSPI